MRTEKELTDYLHRMRHEVANEFTIISCLFSRLRLGCSPEPERITKRQEAMREISEALLSKELGQMLYLVKNQIHDDRKAVIRRYIRRYRIQRKEKD